MKKTHKLIVGCLALLGLISLFIVVAQGLAPRQDAAAKGLKDADAANLIELGQRALQRARQLAPDAVLRQVDVDPQSAGVFFHFTDAAATKEITIQVPRPELAPDQWRVESTSEFSKLVGLGAPGFNLNALRVGPARIVRDMTTHWTGCTPRALTLFGQGDDINWTVFCTLANGGVVDGSVDSRTGVFRPSSAPPAYPPPTATPTP